MYGKGFGIAPGTSLTVTRRAVFDAMEACDPSIGVHAERVSTLAEVIGRRLDWSEEKLAVLRLGAALHDVGKVNVRSSVLAKRGPLTAAELAHVRTHPVEGAWLIAGVPSLVSALPSVLFHHERWDGAGYPTGRAGDDIPPDGRVLAMADAFDAMTSLRPYRDPLSFDDAVLEVERCSGSQFAPDVVAAFLDAVAADEISLRVESLAAAG